MENIIKQWILVLAAISLFFLLFSIRGLAQDPDFGWHLKTGQYILSHGVPRVDLYSYSMPSYPWVDHEWLTELCFWLLFTKAGMLGLAIVLACLTLISLVLQVPRKAKHINLPIFLGSIAVLSLSGIRPQIIGWFFFSLLIWAFRQKQLWYRLRFGLPLFFLIWANLHGSFPIGIVVVVLWVCCKHMKKEEKLIDGLLAALSVIATLVNPYGIGLWHEVWMTFSEPQIHFIIAEWVPSVFFLNFALWLFIIFSSALLLIYRNRFQSGEKIVWLLLLVFALSSIRNIPYFILFGITPFIQSIDAFFLDAKHIPGAKQKLRYVTVLVGIIIVSLLGIQVYFTPYVNNYPKDAVLYLQSHPRAGHILADYNWGGYLIKTLPQEKVFIDGRMTTWQQEPSQTESANALKDYYFLANRVISVQEVTDKYHITTLLVTPKPFSEWQVGEIDSFHVRRLQKYPPIEKQLAADRWHKVYSDREAVIYRR